MTLKHPTAWAWNCDFGLCKWAEPDKERLLLQSKPSPEAKPCCVRLAPNAEYKELSKGEQE